MPYSTADIDEKTMEDRADDSVCAECFSRLVVCWGGFYGYDSMILRCSRDPRHHGLARVAENKEYNINTRREFMEKDIGKEKALALRQFDSVVTLSRKSATDIIKIMWPGAEDASPAEFERAVGLCIDYGLDPRLNEIFLIPFNNQQKDGTYKKEYQTVRGIKATRKVALRKHKYSYIDFTPNSFTPRLMTEEEEKKVYKKVDPEKIRYITILKDLETGAMAPGYGEWNMYKLNKKGQKVLNQPKGVEKGNSMENMSAIHSERQALDRLYPADMPPSRIPVVDEGFIDADYTITNGGVEEVEEEGVMEEDKEYQGGGEQASISPVSEEERDEQVVKDKGGVGTTAQNLSSSLRGKPVKPSPARGVPDPPIGLDIVGEGFKIDRNELNEMMRAINWTDITAKTWIASQLKVAIDGDLSEGLKKLTREQAEAFIDKLRKVQPELPLSDMR